MSRQTIQRVEQRKRKLLLRLRRDAAELVDLEDKLHKMRTGKLKVAPPPGKLGKISNAFTHTGEERRPYPFNDDPD